MKRGLTMGKKKGGGGLIYAKFNFNEFEYAILLGSSHKVVRIPKETNILKSIFDQKRGLHIG